jgi:glutamate carboxypeptidase
LRETVETLVGLESPSTDKTAVDRCGAELSSRLEALGGTVTRLDGGPRGDHVRADFAGSATRLLLLGHFDTVWPVGQLDRMPLREEGGRLHGPGVFDMKAGIGVAMLAVRALRELTLPDAPHVTMLWTTDEEIGSETSRAAIEACARESRAVLVLEPSLPGGAAKTSRKGCGDFELTVHGVSAHAGLDPAKGASAIHELAHQIVAITALQDASRGITLNVGRISGGSRTNVVADIAQASIDVRVPTMADAAIVEQSLRGLRPRLPGTRLDVQGSVGRPPLERGPGVVCLYEVAREVARELGQDLQEGGTGGGSDGNFTAAIGVPTLDGLGPRGDGAHALHEHVELADLAWRAAFLTRLLSRLGRLE